MFFLNEDSEFIRVVQKMNELFFSLKTFFFISKSPNCLKLKLTVLPNIDLSASLAG